MTRGEKLSRLRREQNYTQEQLADLLGVSRQTVSKWESDVTCPETDKLIRMGELFGCSLDYLLREDVTTARPAAAPEPPLRRRLRERKSERTLWGLPLWHVGRDARGIVAVGLRARGVVAIGLRARGVVSLGLLSLGVLSFGVLSLGLLAFGLLAVGAAAAGCFAVGILAAGAISLGVFSLGAVAVGECAVGALAVGRYAAIGDHARAAIALGDTRAVGSLFQHTGPLMPKDLAAVRALIETTLPSYYGWVKALLLAFL